MKRASTIAGVVLILALGVAPVVLACGPFFPQAIFSFALHPDVPFDGYARGVLGIVQPTYARSYLVVAYRHLAGAALDSGEQQAALDLWRERLERGGDDEDVKLEAAIKRWLMARAVVTASGPTTVVSAYRGYELMSYPNCPRDAWSTAVETLEARVRAWGANSAHVKEWLQAQDQVFANCSIGDNVPTPVNGSAPALLRADRAYQIAAAHFYRGDFEAAAEKFQEIAADRISPWHQMALYLVARSLVRAATRSSDEPTRRAFLERAQSQIAVVLGEPRAARIHEAARALHGFVVARLDPEGRRRALARALARPGSSTLKRDLGDYTVLLDRCTAASTCTADGEDLSDWVLTFQRRDDAAREHAIRRWSQRGSVAWLTAALSKVAGDHPKARELLAAAVGVGDGSPAFVTVSFHTVRLLIESAQHDVARDRLTQLLDGRRSALPRSAHNQLVALRFLLARNLDELARDAARLPTLVTTGDEDEIGWPRQTATGETPKALFPLDVARTLNEALPLSRLQQLATSPLLPEHLRREVALAAWVRAALLGDQNAGTALVPVVTALWPELRRDLQAYRAATDPRARGFAATLALLRTPGAQPQVAAGISRDEIRKIDVYRRNWWCPSASATSAVPTFPRFLTPAEQSAARRELEQLRRVATGPNYLAADAIAWAKLRPADDRVPEALHLAVRATRYGCTDPDTSTYSRQAFELLHRRHPGSPWTRKTPYWF